MRGLTTIELMISAAVISIAVLGTISAFSVIAKSVQTTKTKGLAANLAQEKVESLKNLSYFRLSVTTDPASDSNFDPTIYYDGVNGYYPPEVPLTVGGVAFDRRVYIRKVAEKSDGTLEYKPWTNADTGLKEILVYVVYKQGNTWKKVELRNLRDDPNRQPTNCTFSGTVRDSGGTPLSGAHVEVIQNPVWDVYTGATGVWSFQVSAGTYTLQASLNGYFSQSLAQSPINQNDTRAGVDFSLVKMTSGAFSGQGYIRDHLVISQVVASTGPTGLVEFVELYNPTTWAWTMSDASFDLRYVDANNVTITDILLTFDNASIPANGGYYLVASTTNFSIEGQNISADARYQTELDNVIWRERAGGIQIANDAASTVYDRVGWSKNSEGAAAPSLAVEGTQVTLTNGLSAGEFLFRSSMTMGTGNPSNGINAWDSNNNSADFNQGASPQDFNIIGDPHNSASTPRAPSGGTPAAYAIVFADDNLSASTLASSTGFFILTSIATGAWTLNVASGSVYQ
ncbi:MAG: carboxypeptidase regulatory-like domain-containing protein, partial [Elusimicrobiota bacterium]